MKKILVLLSVISLIAWMVSFLSMNYTPMVNIFLLLSILFFIRSMLTVDLGNSPITVEGPGLETNESHS
jgi:hypothetical protein